MSKFTSKANAFIAGESGTTSVEYAVMLALIIGLCIAAISAVGGQNGLIWGNNESEITNALK